MYRRVIIDNYTHLDLNYNEIISEAAMLCRLNSTSDVTYYFSQNTAMFEVKVNYDKLNKILHIKISYAK